jgi:L-lactate dehydrogenase complex protein LldG
MARAAESEAIMSAKDNILLRLRKAYTPFTKVEPLTECKVMVPMDGADLLECFVQQAKALSAHVYQAQNEQDVLDYIMTIIADDEKILAWDFEHIPLDTLENMLTVQNKSVADTKDASVRVGITGVDVALAATGSIVISAREGRPRTVSLLPYTHIAVMREDQIMPHLDAWLAQQSQNTQEFRQVGNHVIITGASRTADIGMELVLGAHGSAELQVIILRNVEQ